jgi:N-acetylglucosaminyldiphosphoundecaprenol N-acetyl-beta-D-mannosaminyltransferase
MINVLNIPLFNGTLSSAVLRVISTCSEQNEKENRCVSATSAHGLVIAQNNEEFAVVLKHNFWNLPDGMPVVWVGRMKGARDMERCYGPDFFKNVMVESANKPIKHYFCGGKEGVAEELRQTCREKFGNHNIVGVYSPPFREMTENEMRSLADGINHANTDIVWIGLSTPKQEIFASRLSRYTKVHFIATVGAAFDFHTDRVRQAPKILQKMGLEWFFRLCKEPKRLFMRYAEVVPLFIYYNLKEFLFRKI